MVAGIIINPSLLAFLALTVSLDPFRMLSHLCLKWHNITCHCVTKNTVSSLRRTPDPATLFVPTTTPNAHPRRNTQTGSSCVLITCNLHQSTAFLLLFSSFFSGFSLSLHLHFHFSENFKSSFETLIVLQQTTIP